MPGVARHLAGDLEHHELVGPSGEAAQSAEVVEPCKDIHQRVVCGLLSEVVKLRAADRDQLTPSPREFVIGDAQQDTAKLGHRLVTARMSRLQPLDPLLRIGRGSHSLWIVATARR
jgi:hypothetical protein